MGSSRGSSARKIAGRQPALPGRGITESITEPLTICPKSRKSGRQDARCDNQRPGLICRNGFECSAVARIASRCDSQTCLGSHSANLDLVRSLQYGCPDRPRSSPIVHTAGGRDSEGIVSIVAAMKRAFLAAPVVLLIASGVTARDLPNFDAAAARRIVPPAVAQAANARIPTEWYAQFGTPSFRWLGGATDGTVMATTMVGGFGGAYVSEVHDTGRGAIVTRYRQRIDGIEVFRHELNVVTTRDGATVAISGHLADVAAHAAAKSGGLFRLSEAAAVAIASGDLDASDPAASRVSRVWFDLGTSLEPAYAIELATDAEMFLYVISAADGRLLFRKNLTAEACQPFTYRVWAETTGVRRSFNGPQGYAGDPNPTGTNDGFQGPKGLGSDL